MGESYIGTICAKQGWFELKKYFNKGRNLIAEMGSTTSYAP